MVQVQSVMNIKAKKFVFCIQCFILSQNPVSQNIHLSSYKFQLFFFAAICNCILSFFYLENTLLHRKMVLWDILASLLGCIPVWRYVPINNFRENIPGCLHHTSFSFTVPHGFIWINCLSYPLQTDLLHVRSCSITI